MQAAGFIEGYLTAPDIFDHWYNMRWWLSQKTNDTYKIYSWYAHFQRHVGLAAKHCSQRADGDSHMHCTWAALPHSAKFFMPTHAVSVPGV